MPDINLKGEAYFLQLFDQYIEETKRALILTVFDRFREFLSYQTSLIEARKAVMHEFIRRKEKLLFQSSGMLTSLLKLSIGLKSIEEFLNTYFNGMD